MQSAFVALYFILILNTNHNIMKHILLSTLVVLFAFTSMSAQKVKGNGKITTKSLTVGDYDEIQMKGSFDMVLVKGKEGEITIQGESNIIPNIMIDVKDGVLHVAAKKGVNLYTKKALIVTVPFQELDAVCLNGSGDIVSEATIEATYLEVKLDGSGDIILPVKTSRLKSFVIGSGDIELSGTTNHLAVMVTGSGDFEGSDLESSVTDATVVGSGDAVVVANESIRAEVAGSGDIEYKGNPKKEKVNVIGSGDITRL